MYRRILPLLVLCCAWLPLRAGGIDDIPLECMPASKAKEPPVFEPSKAHPLSYEEQRDLRRLFADMEGSWHGNLNEQVCMMSGAQKLHDYQATLTVRATHDGLQLSGEYVSPEQHLRRLFKLRLFVTPDGLRVDTPSRAGEVELLGIERHLLDYVRYYRTVQPAENAVQPPAGAGGLAAVHPTEPPLVDGHPAGPNTGKPVAGVSNLRQQRITGNAHAAEPQRYVQARAERVIMELPSHRRLQLTQHYFVQGLYSGNMSWHLRRD
jgi:hypothetical protein